MLWVPPPPLPWIICIALLIRTIGKEIKRDQETRGSWEGCCSWKLHFNGVIAFFSLSLSRSCLSQGLLCRLSVIGRLMTISIVNVWLNSRWRCTAYAIVDLLLYPTVCEFWCSSSSSSRSCCNIKALCTYYLLECDCMYECSIVVIGSERRGEEGRGGRGDGKHIGRVLPNKWKTSAEKRILKHSLHASRLLMIDVTSPFVNKVL